MMQLTEFHDCYEIREPMMKKSRLNLNQNEKYDAIHLNSRETIYIFSSVELCHLFDINTGNLLFQNEAGDIQRNIDVEHLQELILFQQKHFKTFGCYSFSTQIVIAEMNGKYALVDGQHRLEAIRFLLGVNTEHASLIRVPVLSIQLTDLQDYDDVFVAVNKNKPVRLYKNVTDWKTVGKHVEKYFLENYRIYLKTTNMPQVPHINLDYLLKYLDDGDYIQKMQIGFEEFKTEMEELNQFYRMHWKTYLQDTRYLSNVSIWADKCERKQPSRPLYLGMFRQYEWVDRIMEKHLHPDKYKSYHDMIHIPINYRKKINKPLRKQVWLKRNANQLDGLCYVCQSSIHYDTFECGHIVSVFCGGDTTYANLEPICKVCNCDMGIEHLETFKKHNVHIES